MSVIDQPKNGQYVLDAFNGKVIYTPDNDFCGSKPDVFSYAVCTAGGCDTAKVFITISCDAIKIFNAFSPNADGMNDYFLIEGLEKFPNNRVRIFNRWGTEIMRAENYKNDWNGNWNGSELPDGTYFYLVEDGEGHTFTGYVQIQR
jgi:gliding motility-associated-like protein